MHEIKNIALERWEFYKRVKLDINSVFPLIEISHEPHNQTGEGVSYCTYYQVT